MVSNLGVQRRQAGASFRTHPAGSAFWRARTPSEGEELCRLLQGWATPELFVPLRVRTRWYLSFASRSGRFHACWSCVSLQTVSTIDFCEWMDGAQVIPSRTEFSTISNSRDYYHLEDWQPEVFFGGSFQGSPNQVFKYLWGVRGFQHLEVSEMHARAHILRRAREPTVKTGWVPWWRLATWDAAVILDINWQLFLLLCVCVGGGGGGGISIWSAVKTRHRMHCWSPETTHFRMEIDLWHGLHMGRSLYEFIVIWFDG